MDAVTWKKGIGVTMDWVIHI